MANHESVLRKLHPESNLWKMLKKQRKLKQQRSRYEGEARREAEGWEGESLCKGSTRRRVVRLVLRHKWHHWQRIVLKRAMYPAWRGAPCDWASEARWIAAEAGFSRSSKGLGAGSWRLRVAGEHDYTTRYSTSRADLLAEQVTSRHSTSRAPSSWAFGMSPRFALSSLG
jgi:hypothetical protein